MKRLLTLIAATAGIALAAQNPVFIPNAYNSDPQARVWTVDGEERLFIYGSRDENTAYYCSRRYDVFSTTDMIHWQGGESFSSDEVPYNNEFLYAPDCMEKDGKYYLYYSQSGSGFVEGTAVSDSPYGPFRDGKPVEWAQQIDPSVFVDDDGTAWLFWGQFSAKCAKLNPDMRSIDPTTNRDGIITESEHHFHEGIQAFKHNGTYYLVFADISRRGTPTCLGYATSDSVTGPYTYRGVIIDNFGCDPAVWNNHGSVACFKGQWYVFYHRSSCGSVTMRSTCIEPIEILPDGSIPEVRMTSTGAGDPLSPFVDDNLPARACMLKGHVRIDRDLHLSGIRGGDMAEWINFDFLVSPTTFSITVIPNTGGRIRVATDLLYKAPLATIEVPSGDGETPITLETKLNSSPIGILPLRLLFDGPDTSDLFTIVSFSFKI